MERTQVKGLQRVTLEPFMENGEGGIRTHGTVNRTRHFQCRPFGHSGTSPRGFQTGDSMLAVDVMQARFGRIGSREVQYSKDGNV